MAGLLAWDSSLTGQVRKEAAKVTDNSAGDQARHLPLSSENCTLGY